MSDPIANAEIEDVLSSIRRLVSAEERGERLSRRHHDRPGRAGAKLVLTPADRVDDAPPDMSLDAADETCDAIEIDPPERHRPGRVRDYGAAEDAEIIDAGDPAGGDAPPPDIPAAAEAAPQAAATSPGDPDPEAVDAAREAIGDATGPAFEDASAGAGGDAFADGSDGAGDEAALARFMRHAASDTGDRAALADPDPDAETAELSGQPGAEALPGAMADPVPEHEPMAETGESRAEDDLGDIGARIAELESAVARQPGEWEPDGAPGDGDNAAGPDAPLPWDELETAPPTGGDGTDPVGGGEGDGAAERDARRAGWYSDEALIDEDALRDLVGEIVREELQGALGERITRNVRKLVRREIHRALMTQNLDD